jgi:predicted acetyltransferase
MLARAVIRDVGRVLDLPYSEVDRIAKLVPAELKITLKDSFLRENEGSTIVHFQDGKPTVKPRGEHEVEIRMDVADFSSLLMGVIPFQSLLAYGLAGISKEKYTTTVNRLFLTEAKPVCLSEF